MDEDSVNEQVMIEIRSVGDPASIAAAQQLYVSLGFQRVAPYRAVEFGETWFYERTLGAATI